MKYLRMLRTGKAKEDKNDIWHILAPSLFGMSVCVLCLCGSSWAWFTAIQNSPVEKIEAATYDLSVSVEEQILTPDEQGNSSVDLEQGQSYLITLKADGTADSGYGQIIYGEDIYYTEPIKSGDSISFTIYADQSATLSIEAFWGSCSEEDEQNLIGDGTVIGDAVTTPTEDESTLPEDEDKDQEDSTENTEEDEDTTDSEESGKEDESEENETTDETDTTMDEKESDITEDTEESDAEEDSNENN